MNAVHTFRGLRLGKAFAHCKNASIVGSFKISNCCLDEFGSIGIALNCSEAGVPAAASLRVPHKPLGSTAEKAMPAAMMLSNTLVHSSGVKSFLLAMAVSNASAGLGSISLIILQSRSCDTCLTLATNRGQLSFQTWGRVMLARLPWLVTWDAILSGSSPAWLGVVAMLAVLSSLCPREAKTKTERRLSPRPPIVDIPKRPTTCDCHLLERSESGCVPRHHSWSRTLKFRQASLATQLQWAYTASLRSRRWHESNIYSGAPMPWMRRLTWSGMALRGGVVPGYPASHGCVRLYSSFASQLFQMTNRRRECSHRPGQTGACNH